MSNFTKFEIYKPDFLIIELQKFQNHSVCWVSGPYYTFQKIYSNRFPFAFSKEKVRFSQAILAQSSTFYKTETHKNLQKKINQELSLLYVYMRQQMIGSSVGFQKFLQIRGVGYTFSISSTNLTIDAGYSHVLRMKIPKFHLLTQSKKETSLSIQSSNLVQLNKFLSTVRSWRKPDVYKGKGIRYQNEIIKLKEGKKKKTSS